MKKKRRSKRVSTKETATSKGAITAAKKALTTAQCPNLAL
jgi:hypothetical protein